MLVRNLFTTTILLIFQSKYTIHKCENWGTSTGKHSHTIILMPYSYSYRPLNNHKVRTIRINIIIITKAVLPVLGCSVVNQSKAIIKTL